MFARAILSRVARAHNRPVFALCKRTAGSHWQQASDLLELFACALLVFGPRRRRRRELPFEIE